VGEGNEHRATKGSAFLCAQSEFYTGYYHPKKSKELDSLGVDLLTFLANCLNFPTQVKSRYFDLATHYRNYPYIHGIALNGDRDIAKIGLNLGKTITEHGEKFFTLTSCVPTDMHGGKEKHTQCRESQLLSALTDREPMVAYYHEALRGGEIRGLGATGLIFLRNGFALFLRREIKDLPASGVPHLLLPTHFDARGDAAAIVSFIRETGTNFFAETSLI
jgi:hypothetical protein